VARTLAANTWVALAEFAAKPDRQSAVVAGAEARIDRVLAAGPLGSATLLASRDGLRVVAIVWVDGPEGFAALGERWGEPDVHPARADKDETARLTLCRCVSTSGDPTFAARTADMITFDAFETGSKAAVDGAALADRTVLGMALLRDESSANTYILTRRSRIDRSARRYQIVRIWDHA